MRNKRNIKLNQDKDIQISSKPLLSKIKKVEDTPLSKPNFGEPTTLPNPPPESWGYTAAPFNAVIDPNLTAQNQEINFDDLSGKWTVKMDWAVIKPSYILQPGEILKQTNECHEKYYKDTDDHNKTSTDFSKENTYSKISLKDLYHDFPQLKNHLSSNHPNDTFWPYILTVNDFLKYSSSYTRVQFAIPYCPLGYLLMGYHELLVRADQLIQPKLTEFGRFQTYRLFDKIQLIYITEWSGQQIAYVHELTGLHNGLA